MDARVREQGAILADRANRGKPSTPGLVPLATVLRLSKFFRSFTAVVHRRREKVEARGPLSRGDFLRSLWK
jgi:hypothetical protein